MPGQVLDTLGRLGLHGAQDSGWGSPASDWSGSGHLRAGVGNHLHQVMISFWARDVILMSWRSPSSQPCELPNQSYRPPSTTLATSIFPSHPLLPLSHKLLFGSPFFFSLPHYFFQKWFHGCIAHLQFLTISPHGHNWLCSTTFEWKFDASFQLQCSNLSLIECNLELLMCRCMLGRT